MAIEHVIDNTISSVTNDTTEPKPYFSVTRIGWLLLEILRQESKVMVNDLRLFFRLNLQNLSQKRLIT